MSDHYVSLEKAAEVVRKMNHRDMYANVGDLDIGIGRSPEGVPNFSISVERKDVGVMDRGATKDLMRLLRVPAAALTEYADEPELINQMVNCSRKKRLTKPVRLMFLNDRICGIESPKDGDVSLTLNDVWECVGDLEDVRGVQSINCTGSSFNLRLISEFNNTPVRDTGDVSHGGIRISMNGSTKVTPYVYRLVCTNGMQCARDLVDVLSESDDSKDTFMDRLRNAMNFAFTASREALTCFVKTDETVIENPVQYLLKLMHMHGIPDGHQTKVIKRIEEEVERNTLYELTNLVTNYAREQKPRLRERLERFGSEVCHSEGARCGKCNSPVTA